MRVNNRLVSIAKIASTTDDIPPKVLRFMLQSAARELIPHERVAQCLRSIVPHAERVEIHKTDKPRSAHYRNLLVCGRIWHCPVCGQKISEVRRKELSDACNHWVGGLVLVTYTITHHSNQSLDQTLSSLIDIYSKFKSGRGFATISEEFGWLGSVKALEITHGLNGWHPHIHELVFTLNVLTEAQKSAIGNHVGRLWRHKAQLVGKFASVDRGVTVKTANSEVSDYVSKFGETKVSNDWNFAHELTKQIVKRGKLNGQSPTQLLYDYMLGDKSAGRLWSEYAHTVKGRHQLVWSRGMRQRVLKGRELDDEQIAAQLPQNSTMLASLTRGQWYDVLQNGDVASILQMADEKSQDEFEAWLINKLASYAT